MKEIEIKSLRSVGIVFIAIHLIIFGGVFLEGIHVIRTRFVPSDALYGLITALLGGLLLLIAVKSLIDVFHRHWPRNIASRWRGSKYRISASIFLVFLTYILDERLASGLWFIGHSAGHFLIQMAGSAYYRLLSIDLDVVGFSAFAWIFQYYFIAYLVNILLRLLKRIKKGKEQLRKITE